MSKITSGEKIGAIAAAVAMAVVITVALLRDNSSRPLPAAEAPAPVGQTDSVERAQAAPDSLAGERYSKPRQRKKSTRKQPSRRAPKRRSPLDEPV